jgi:pathogenesis-related protein 1
MLNLSKLWPLALGLTVLTGAALAETTTAQPASAARKCRGRKCRPPKSDPKSTPTAPPTSSNRQTELLAAHNKVRAQHGLPNLTWSSEMESLAQDWADQMTRTGKFDHRPNNRYGENLFWGRGRDYSGTYAIESWASEASGYNYANNSCQGVCGHYTQLVWKNTTQVGCAVGKVRDEVYWVCNYNPPGNYVGQKPY